MTGKTSYAESVKDVQSTSTSLCAITGNPDLRKIIKETKYEELAEERDKNIESAI